MQPSIARAMFQLLEPIATVAYFAPELREVCDRLGLTEHRMSYYAPRAAALGPVAAELVSACFFHHTMHLVSPAIPRAWQIADPNTILAARLEAVDGALRRLWSERVNSAPMVEAAGLAREAAEHCDLGGRALFAAHAALPWPQQSHLILWQALNLLREHRGDGHIISIVGARLDPCEATVTLIASAGEDKARRRGRWRDDDWNAAVSRLQARGWLDSDGHPTAAGLAGRDEVERNTDQLAMRPWEQLGLERTHRLWELLKALVDVIAERSGVPLRTPLGVSWPAIWPGG